MLHYSRRVCFSISILVQCSAPSAWREYDPLPGVIAAAIGLWAEVVGMKIHRGVLTEKEGPSFIKS